VTAEEAVVLVNQTEQKDCCTHNGTTLTITLADIRPEDTIEIRLPQNTQVAANPVQQQIFDFLNQAEIDFIAKEKIYQAARHAQETPELLLSELQSMEITPDLSGAIQEIICAYLKR